MAELATIARPYAEALFEAAGGQDAGAVGDQLQALVDVTGDAELRQFAGHPKVADKLVFNVVSDVLARKSLVLTPLLQNFLQTVIENGRMAALPAIAHQFKTLANARQGVSDAIVYSAFPIETAALPGVVAALEKRFARRLNAKVEIDPGLIGGIRAVVGDEVLDTSVRARLEKMRLALAA